MKKLAENVFWIVPALLVPVVIAAVFLLQQKYETGSEEPEVPNPLEVASETEKKEDAKSKAKANQKKPEPSPLNDEKRPQEKPAEEVARTKPSDPKPGNVAQPAPSGEKEVSRPQVPNQGGPIIAEAKSAVSDGKEKPEQVAEPVRKEVKLPQDGTPNEPVAEMPESTRPKPVVEEKKPEKPTEPEEIEYVVRSGDNPWTIAQQHGVKMEDLLSLNKIENPKNLKIGQVLKIPPRSPGASPKQTAKPVAETPPPPAEGDGYQLYTIKSGENPWTIAKKLKVSHQQILDLNEGLNFRDLKIGQQIKVPRK